MKKPLISLIACVGKNRELGFQNDLIWRIPEDMAYFREITSGHPVIMGQRTYESIGRPLSDRLNIVLSKDPNFSPEGVVKSCSIKDALSKATGACKGEVFFIGGANVYEQAIKIADRLYVTEVHEIAPSDVFFPDYSGFKFLENRGNGEYKGIKYEFNIYRKS